jgi:hypothetical protein
LSTINRKIFFKVHGQKTGKWFGKAQRHKNAGTQQCDCLGVVSGASNRDAPRGARAQKQTDMASDARQHGERERFSLSFDEASNATLKSCLLFSQERAR